MGNSNSINQVYYAEGNLQTSTTGYDKYTCKLSGNVLYIKVCRYPNSSNNLCCSKEHIIIKFYEDELQLVEKEKILKEYTDLIHHSMNNKERKEYKDIHCQITNESYFEETILRDQIHILVNRIREGKYTLLKSRNEDIGMIKKEFLIDMLKVTIHPGLITEMLSFTTLLLVHLTHGKNTSLDFDQKL